MEDYGAAQFLVRSVYRPLELVVSSSFEEMPEPRPSTVAHCGTDGENSLRVAFMVEGKPDLRLVSVDAPLHSIIQDLMEHHRLRGNPEDYALIYKPGERIKDYRIVTERDRADMNANIIELGESPTASTTRIITEIKKVDPDPKELVQALNDLRRMCVDASFAKVFFARGGLWLLMQGVASTKFRVSELGIVLDAMNQLVDNLVDADLLKGQTVHQDFVKQLADLTTKEGEAAYSLALRCSLSLLATFVGESEESRGVIDREVALPNLISLVASADTSVQLHSLTLINQLLRHAAPDRKVDMVMALQGRQARQLILEHLLTGSQANREAMAHQLYLLQHHMLGQVLTRLHTKIEPQDGAALNKIKELRSTAFDTGSPTIKNNTRYAQDHKKLGFDNVKDPSLDFLVTPPGILALDCMDHFAKTRHEQFIKVVLENSCRSDNHECPFAASSIELVRQLADILAIGQPPDPNCKVFHEMFFKSEHPFEEFFCYCVVLLNKTWRDMRATKEDFNKVFDVVVEQIKGSLSPERSQDRPKTFEAFRANVRSYTDISRKWQSDARSRKAWDNSAPVAELRKHLKPEIEELVRQQRGNFMVEGTRFQRYKKSGEQAKSQFRYVKLHTNHKTIYVGDWNSDKSLPTIEDLEPRLQIADIQLVTGADCQFLKVYKKELYQQVVKLAFSLVGENTSLDLVAPDQQTFNYWVDGIRCLKQQEMVSEDYEKEMKVLLDMEVKLRLLDLEGVELPSSPPTVPPPPTDFNFSSC